MPCNNQRGMVLLLVLVVIALLCALISEFAFSTLIDLRMAETFRDATRAEYLARGGIKAGSMLLQMDKNSYDAAVPSELWAVGIEQYPVAEGYISIKITDLDGRLLLNKLVDQAGNQNGLYRERFIRLCTELAIDNPEELADSLIDWIDPDHEPLPGGAEDSDYLQRNPPYEATDGPLIDLDELRLVRGFNSDVIERLRPYVTVFGSGRLNINTASAELLRSWDSEAAPAVDSLLSKRVEKPFQQLSELQETLGVEAFTALNRNLDLSLTSSYYLIRSHGQVNDGSQRIQAVVNKNQHKLLWQKAN